MGRNAESSLPERAMTTANTCGDMQRRVPAKGPRVRHRRLTHEAARTVTTQAGNLADQRRNGRPRPRRRGLPRQTEHAHGGRLVFTRENARDGFGHALDGASSAEPARSISGNRPKSAPRATFSATPSRSGGKGSALQLGERSGSRAWERASRPMCDGHSRKSFSSRALRTPQRDPSPAHIPRLCAA